MRKGDLVRIKEIAGTKLASKRSPVWGVINHVNPSQLVENELDRTCTVTLLQDVDFGDRYRSRKRLSCLRRHFDYPTDKQVPDWVWVEVAKRALLSEGENT